MELIIDSQRCDLPQKAIRIPAYDTTHLADIAAAREGRRLHLTLPATPTNDRLFGYGRDPETGVCFNDKRHEATLSAEGATLFEGRVLLLEASEKGYRIELREAGAGWATQAALRKIDELGIDYHESLTPTTISNSWENDVAVRFFPIHRDSYPAQHSSMDLLPTERLHSVDDYHPFLHLATLIETLFNESGYTLRSRFFDSELFRSLYMSGAYATRDTTAVEQRMGFFARRLTTASATANNQGRVTASPFTGYSTVGNLVESATPHSVDEEGVTLTELYNNGGCFGLDADGAICFTPTTSLDVGFEYYLRYTTEHRIRSRHELTGFNGIYLGKGSDMRFVLPNRYDDRRESLAANHLYRVVVFNHKEGTQYRLRYTLNGVPWVEWCQFSERTAQVGTPSQRPENPSLEHFLNGVWQPYNDDWALYDGHIEECGETLVELRVRASSESCSPTSPKYFDTIYFYGAEEGQRLTLDKRCSVRPVFQESPAFGTMLRFADVAQHGARQIELLEAVAHLFNLRFYTEEATRTVWVEPYDDFYEGEAIDWRKRVDWSSPIVFEAVTPELNEMRTWCYLAGDGAVTRYEQQAQTRLGSWSVATASSAAKQGEQLFRNPLFAPAMLSQGHYRTAPSAWLLQVGDRDAVGADGEVLTPRLVRYLGLHPLAEGEQWSNPANEGGYPLAAFHFAGDEAVGGATLCFEDRDGLEGLHRFYDRNLAHEVQGGRVSLTLRLAPYEVETLLHPATGAPTLRSLFRLASPMGEFCGVLHRIGEYDAKQQTVRCTFNRVDR